MALKPETMGVQDLHFCCASAIIAASKCCNSVLQIWTMLSLYKTFTAGTLQLEQRFNLLQARQILVQNPQLTKALFQAQILLGMVKPAPAPGPSQIPGPGPGPGPGPAQEPNPQISGPPHMQPQPVQVKHASKNWLHTPETPRDCPCPSLRLQFLQILLECLTKTAVHIHMRAGFSNKFEKSMAFR